MLWLQFTRLVAEEVGGITVVKVSVGPVSFAALSRTITSGLAVALE
jgi:hypothetical protein